MNKQIIILIVSFFIALFLSQFIVTHVNASCSEFPYNSVKYPAMTMNYPFNNSVSIDIIAEVYDYMQVEPMIGTYDIKCSGIKQYKVNWLKNGVEVINL